MGAECLGFAPELRADLLLGCTHGPDDRGILKRLDLRLLKRLADFALRVRLGGRGERDQPRQPFHDFPGGRHPDRFLVLTVGQLPQRTKVRVAVVRRTRWANAKVGGDLLELREPLGVEASKLGVSWRESEYL